MELRPYWKIRWIAIVVLTLPTFVWIVRSLRHPGTRELIPASVRAQASAAANTTAAASPWVMQESGTTAGLRGIYSYKGKIAWASGTEGTVLVTEDGGGHWRKCALPPDSETLDFRGVQAWFNEAVVMASGPGTKSRLYRTQDNCKSWTLEATNADKEGFWDSIVYVSWHYFGDPVMPDYAVVIGDPLNEHFDTRNDSMYFKPGEKNPSFGWHKQEPGCEAKNGEALFAASNSSVALTSDFDLVIGTGGKSGAFVLFPKDSKSGKKAAPCTRVAVPMAGGTEASGIFSLAFRDEKHGMAVGGDYTKPNEATGTAAFTKDGGLHWTAATTPPHGYRSSVAWSEQMKAWITVGTNGSDISRDDGETWAPMDDGNWNALSLPFVVGPKGRIARLSATAAK